MRQIIDDKNQSVFLDPEKVYFVEKFGYLIKNIDNSFAGPIQDALIQRIFFTVDQFTKDLPDIVKEIEKIRIKNILNKKRANNYKLDTRVTAAPKHEESKSEPIAINNVPLKTETPSPKQDVIETEVEIDIKELPKTYSPKVASVIGSSILRPSAAAIIEENRQIQLRKIQEQKIAEKEQNNIPLVTRPNNRPKKELTVWERAWHRYGGYTEEVMNGHG